MHNSIHLSGIKSFVSLPVLFGALAVGVVVGLVVVLLSQQVGPTVPAAVNETVENDVISVRVVSVTEVAARELMSGTVIDGQKGLVVRVHVENLSDDTQAFLPANQLFLKTRDGLLYQMKPIRGIEDTLRAGEVNPGESIEGNISFMVQAGSDELWLYFDTRWQDSLPVAVKLATH